MKTASTILILALLLITATVHAEPAGARHAVMISIDGLKPEYILDAKQLGVKLPNIGRLMAEGAWADGVTCVLPTVTYPMHVTLITGVAPREHGITANEVFDPLDTSDGAWHWFASDIRVPTLVSAAHAKGLTSASVSWPATIGNDAEFNVPEYWRNRSKHDYDRNLLAFFSNPRTILDTVGASRGRRIPSFSEMNDQDRTDIARWIIENQHPALVLLHIFDLDFAQHRFGPMSPEAIAAVEAADARVGEILASISKAGIEAGTLVLVVSDHGFVPTKTAIKPNVWLRDAGFYRLDDAGRPTGWDAFFETEGGSAMLRLRDPKDAATLARVKALLEEKKKDAASGIRAILDAEQVGRMGNDAPLALDADAGFSFARGAGGNGSEASPMKGNHGYAPGRRAIEASLVVAGPGVIHHSLGTIDATAVAGIVAGWLGIELAPDAAKAPAGIFESPATHANTK